MQQLTGHRWPLASTLAVLTGCVSTTPVLDGDCSPAVAPSARPALRALEGTELSYGPVRVIGQRDTEDGPAALTTEQERLLREALAETWRVVTSDAFVSRAHRDPRWYAAVGNDWTLRGEEVTELYPAYVPAFVVRIQPKGSGKVRATTMVSPPRLTLPISTLVDWRDEARRAALVGTLAHETAHLVAQKVGRRYAFAFADKGFSLYPCKQAHLVSYKVGHMAHCVFEGGDFAACMDDRHDDMAIPLFTYPWAPIVRALCDDYDVAK